MKYIKQLSMNVLFLEVIFLTLLVPATGEKVPFRDCGENMFVLEITRQHVLIFRFC